MDIGTRSIIISVAVVSGVVLLSACSGRAGESAMGPEREFSLNGRRVSFSPPAGDWQRRDFVADEKRGIQFLLDEGDGGGIAAGELTPIGMVDRVDQLRALVRDAGALTNDEIATRIRQCRIPPSRFISPGEASTYQQAEAILDRASYTNRRLMNRDTAVLLGEALHVLEGVSYSLEDVVERVLPEVDRVARFVGAGDAEGQAGELAGLPAWRLDYRSGKSVGGRLGRELWVLKDDRLFFFAYWGAEDGLSTFEKVTASVRFPESTEA